MTFNIPKYFTRSDLKLSGVYFLIYRKKIVYIGKSENVMMRLFSGSHDIVANKKFDSIRIIPCDKSKLDFYEYRWIIRFRPKYNRRHLFAVSGPHFSKRIVTPINLHAFRGKKLNLL